MSRQTKAPLCARCDRLVRPSTGIVIENIYDGETLLMHRPCVLKIVAQCPEELAAQIHHQLNVQCTFRDGDRALMEAKGEDIRQESNRTAVDLFFPDAPTVPQHPIGYIPTDEA